MSWVDRRRVLWTLGIVLAMVAGFLFVRVAAKAQAAFAGPWSITMASERGDYIGGSAERFFDDANGSLSVATGNGTVLLDASGGTYGESFRFSFEAPSGQAFGPGWYGDAQRYPFQAAGRPGIDVSGEGRGCNEIAGNFEVRDIAWSATGTLQRLWLIYEQHCEGGIPALSGEVRIGMSVGVADVEPDVVRSPDIHPGAQGEAVPVRVRNTGGSALGVSGVTLGGEHPQDFSIRSDGCTGQTLVEGDACLVYVRFAPKSPGPRSAVLRLATDAAALLVALDGYGLPGITDWQMTSDAGDYIGAGGTYHYTSAADRIGYSGSPQYVSGGIDGANGDWWGASFVPAVGDVLVSGETYPDAHRHPFNGTGPGMDVSGNGRGCNTLVGTFTVNQIGFSSGNGKLDRLDLSFEQHCEGANPALRGRLRYRARADVTPPAQAAGVTVTRTSSTSARLSWTNPPDGDHAGTVVRYLPGSQGPGLATVGFLAYSGGGTSVDVSGLSAGSPYSFAVFTYDSTGNVSRARVVSLAPPAPPRLTITATPTTITYGSTASVKGVLTDSGGVPIAGRTTRLQWRTPGTATWNTGATLTTSSTGTVSATAKPSANREYRLVADATSESGAATSAVALVKVRTKVTATLSATSITLGQTVTIKGSVAPNHAGRPVILQRYSSGMWVTAMTATLTSTSTYSFSYKPGSKGYRTLRVYRAADTDHATGTSATMRLTIT